MVARYNPCGRVVDIGHDAGITHARLYPDDPTIYEIRWYVARDDAPLLGCPSALNNWALVKDCEKDRIPIVGEIPYAGFDQEPACVNLLALGEHRCGSPADFAGDGTFDGNAPFVSYRPDGLPACCGNLFEGGGGLAIGGTADVHSYYTGRGGLVIGGTAIVSQYYVGRGGLAIGGTAGVVNYYQGTGGLVIGGTAWVSQAVLRFGSGGLVFGGEAYAIQPEAFGGDCSTAGWLLVGNTTSVTLPVALTSIRWGVFPAVAGAEYEIVLDGDASTPHAQIFGGTACGDFEFSTSATIPSTGIYSISTDGFIWVELNGNTVFPWIVDVTYNPAP